MFTYKYIPFYPILFTSFFFSFSIFYTISILLQQKNKVKVKLPSTKLKPKLTTKHNVSYQIRRIWELYYPITFSKFAANTIPTNLFQSYLTFSAIFFLILFLAKCFWTTPKFTSKLFWYFIFDTKSPNTNNLVGCNHHPHNN